MRTYLKIIILIGIIFAGIYFIIQTGSCQQSEAEKILTEIRIDVRYIKNNIEEMKNDFKEIKSDFTGLERRVTSVEYRTDNLETIICNIEDTNKWFLGILAMIIGGLVLYQYKIASQFRSENGEYHNKDN